MNHREIAVAVSNDNQEVSVTETIDATKNAGFKNVFIQWYNKDWNPSQEEQLKYVREQGLNVIFAHLGYQNINDLWLENENGENLVPRYINDLKICKENNIPMVVMHLTSKSVAPIYNEIGIKRLQKIVDYAESLNIQVAFENTKTKGYLEYVMNHIHNKNAGICFDSGHYHVYFDDELDFSKFKDRIFAVHLHDNDKSGDLHLIPFDGTLDWANIINNLKDNGYQGPVTLELCYRYDYLKDGINNFYKKGYEAAYKLQELFEGL